MRRHLRRASSILAFAVLALGLLNAEQVRQLQPNGFVNDFANVIDAESNRQIQYLCTQVDQRAQAQIAVVTVQSLDGSPIETFARRLFHQWGIGPKSNNRGVLILLAIRDHKYRIEVGTGLEPVVTDRKAAGFGREAVPYLKEFKYGRALQVITRRVTDAIAADAHISIGDAPAPTPVPAASYQYSSSSDTGMAGVIGGFLIVLLVIGGILWIVVVASRSGYSGSSYGYGYPVYQNVGGYYNHSNTVLINGFGGSSNSSGSSSWGGGGGFGGGGDSSSFGGGSSSGGGASGDWSSSSDSSSSESSSSSSSDSSSSSSSSDFGGGSSDGGGSSGSW
ncbi:MAG TPA: TPM domain-containing protein [Candidatus Angelobacter sp.]|jgi:uncharacterized protein